MSEEQGQAQEQPSETQLAVEAAGRILEPEKKAQPAPEAEAPAEEVEAAPEGETALEAEIRKHKLTVKAEGGTDEEIEVDDNELKSGYMRQKDYQRKTAEVARAREAAAEEVRKQVDPLVQQYQTQLQVYEKAVWQVLAPEMQNTDWNALARDNPAEWAQKMQTVTNLQNVFNGIQQEKQAFELKAQQEQQKQQAKIIQESKRILSEDIPGWSDQKYQSILKAGIDYYGYQADEVQAVTDARAIKVLHDAMKYRELQAAKPAVEKKVAAVPKVAKPGSSEKPDPNRENLAKAMAKLKKTGRTEDAVAAARHFFE